MPIACRALCNRLPGSTSFNTQTHTAKQSGILPVALALVTAGYAEADRTSYAYGMQYLSRQKRELLHSLNGASTATAGPNSPSGSSGLLHRATAALCSRSHSMEPKIAHGDVGLESLQRTKLSKHKGPEWISRYPSRVCVRLTCHGQVQSSGWQRASTLSYSVPWQWKHHFR